MADMAFYQPAPLSKGELRKQLSLQLERLGVPMPLALKGVDQITAINLYTEYMAARSYAVLNQLTETYPEMAANALEMEARQTRRGDYLVRLAQINQLAGAQILQTLQEAMAPSVSYREQKENVFDRLDRFFGFK